MADTQCMIEIEAFSCLRQAIVRFLIDFECCTGLPATHPQGVGACEAHFQLLGPCPQPVTADFDTGDRGGRRCISSTLGKPFDGSQFMSLHSSPSSCHTTQFHTCFSCGPKLLSTRLHAGRVKLKVFSLSILIFAGPSFCHAFAKPCANVNLVHKEQCDKRRCHFATLHRTGSCDQSHVSEFLHRTKTCTHTALGLRDIG